MELSETANLAADASPSLLVAGLRIACALGLLVGLASLWIWWQRRGPGCGRNLDVLERTALTRGASLALVHVDGRRLLVGISGDGVRLITELEARNERARPAASFRDALAKAVGAGKEGS